MSYLHNRAPQVTGTDVWNWTRPDITFPTYGNYPANPVDGQFFKHTGLAPNQFFQYENGTGWVNLGPSIGFEVPLLPTGTSPLQIHDDNNLGSEASLFLIYLTGSDPAPLLMVDRGFIVKKDLMVGGFLNSGQGTIWLNYGLVGRPILSSPPCIQLMSSQANYPSGSGFVTDQRGWEVGQLFNLTSDYYWNEKTYPAGKYRWNGNDWIKGDYTGNYDTLYLFQDNLITPAHLDLGSLTAHSDVNIDMEKRVSFSGSSGGTTPKNLGLIQWTDTYLQNNRILDYKGIRDTDGKYYFHWNYWDGSQWNFRAALSQDGNLTLAGQIMLGSSQHGVILQHVSDNWLTIQNQALTAKGGIYCYSIVTDSSSTINGQIYSAGPSADLAFDNRQNSSQVYLWYATNSGSHLNFNGGTDLLTVDSSGNVSLTGSLYGLSGTLNIGTDTKISHSGTTYFNVDSANSSTAINLQYNGTTRGVFGYDAINGKTYVTAQSNAGNLEFFSASGVIKALNDFVAEGLLQVNKATPVLNLCLANGDLRMAMGYDGSNDFINGYSGNMTISTIYGGDIVLAPAGVSGSGNVRLWGGHHLTPQSYEAGMVGDSTYPFYASYTRTVYAKYSGTYDAYNDLELITHWGEVPTGDQFSMLKSQENEDYFDLFKLASFSLGCSKALTIKQNADGEKFALLLSRVETIENQLMKSQSVSS